jgi:hypothetical protein
MFVHGKDTEITVDGVDISEYTDSSELPRTRDSHDTTTYGNGAHRKRGGLRDGTFTCSGTYDNTAVTGPDALFNRLLTEEDPITVVFKAEGTGTGKPTKTFDAVLTKFTPTHPVADMVKWSAEFDIDGEVVPTTQA